MQIRVANITLEKCLKQLKELAAKPYVFTEEIPEVLKEDFRTFIIGRTLNTIDNREAIIDFKAYFDKVMYKGGVNYPIQWATSSN